MKRTVAVLAVASASAVAVAHAAAVPSAVPPTRTCAEGIGYSGPPYWGGKGALVVGPLSFSGLADHPGGARQPDGRWFVKSVLLMKPGAKVTLSVLPGSTARAVLVYAHRESQAVRFEPCAAANAKFSGGFVIRRLRCATILVRVEGGRTYRRTLDFRGFLGGRC
jgi:hypothetical protein